MLWTVAVVLLSLWEVGLASSYTLGGFIHILLFVALVVILVRVIRGRYSAVPLCGTLWNLLVCSGALAVRRASRPRLAPVFTATHEPIRAISKSTGACGHPRAP